MRLHNFHLLQLWFACAAGAGDIMADQAFGLLRRLCGLSRSRMCTSYEFRFSKIFSMDAPARNSDKTITLAYQKACDTRCQQEILDIHNLAISTDTCHVGYICVRKYSTYIDMGVFGQHNNHARGASCSRDSTPNPTLGSCYGTASTACCATSETHSKQSKLTLQCQCGMTFNSTKVVDKTGRVQNEFCSPAAMARRVAKNQWQIGLQSFATTSEMSTNHASGVAIGPHFETKVKYSCPSETEYKCKADGGYFLEYGSAALLPISAYCAAEGSGQSNHGESDPDQFDMLDAAGSATRQGPESEMSSSHIF